MDSEALDFLWVVNKEINSLNLFEPSVVGGLLEGDSITVLPMPSGNETMYQDGSREVDYNIEVVTKNRNQFKGYEQLLKIAKHLEDIDTNGLISTNGSFYFELFKVQSTPSIVAQDEQGYFIYQTTLTARIIINGE